MRALEVILCVVLGLEDTTTLGVATTLSVGSWCGVSCSSGHGLATLVSEWWILRYHVNRFPQRRPAIVSGGHAVERTVWYAVCMNVCSERRE